MTKKALWMILASISLTASSTQAQNFSNHARRGTSEIGGGLGFMLDPNAFLLGVSGGHFITNNLELGGLMQMGVDDNFFIMAPSFQVKGKFDIPGSGFERRLKPFAQGGIGMAFGNADVGTSSDSDVGFLIDVGMGLDVHLTDEWSLGTDLLFNILPAKLFSDRFFFSWQFVTARYSF